MKIGIALLAPFAALLVLLALAAALVAVPANEARAGLIGQDHPGEYPLHCAAGRDNDLAAVIHLLGNAHEVDVVDVNARDWDGSGSPGSASYYSCRSGQHYSYGHTPLQKAAWWGNATIVATLIAAGADVNARDDGGNFAHGPYTPLYLVSPYGPSRSARPPGGESVVSVLLAAGGHWGVACAEPAVVNPAFFDPPCLCESPNVWRNLGVNDETPACEVVAVCDSPAVLDAVANRCDCPAPNAGTDGAVAPGDCAVPSVESCGGLNPPEFFDAALVSITAGECVPFVSCPTGAALDQETNTCEFTLASCTAATLFYNGTDCESFKPCYGGTLDRGTNTCECAAPAVLDGAGNNCECLAPNLRFAVGDCRAPSAANCAERYDPPRFYSPTLSACASHDECIAVGDCTHAPIAHGLGESDWAAAIMANSYEVVSHLIADHGRNPEDLDLSHTRRPPLHHAALWESDQAALALIEGGADVNRVYGEVHHGETPLHRAAQTGSAAVAKVLLSRGANLDAADYTGDTPLHEAVRRSDAAENVALVSLLLDKGADPNIRGYRGWRPLDLASHGGNADTWQARRDMMAALIAWGADWSDECSGGAIPNENYRGLAQVATYPECRCPPHLSERDGGGECVCPAHSHSQVNELCLPKDSAQVADEIEKMRAELEELRALLAALNVQLTLAADGPPETLEEVAKQAEQAARGIARRRNNFLALARAGLAEADDAGAAPTLALSDTEATCRMLEGEVQTHSRSGAKICSGIDHNDTFCIVGSASAFPCVGFFRHVRRCNDDHNRPALDPWHCAAPCPSGLRARGAKCAAD